MGKLGDFLSSENKEKLADNCIEIGNVIRCLFYLSTPPKTKIFIVIGRDPCGNYVGVVLVNSTINFNVINSPVLEGLQYSIEKDSNDFLKKDSYVDCSVLYKYDYNILKSKIISQREIVTGSLKHQDLENIISLIKTSPKIAPITLKELGLIT